MLFSSAAICDPGPVRVDNQDNLFMNGIHRRVIESEQTFQCENVCTGRGLYAVADGMGGEANGAEASSIAVRDLNLEEHASAEALTKYLLERNERLCDLMEQSGQRMGTTFVGLCVGDDTAEIVNIGDSRVYLMRSRVLSQLSCDHTAVRPMVEMGLLSREAARSHPDRHRLSQHLGVFPEELLIEPFATQISTRPGDLFLLCSDGLTEGLEDEEIELLLRDVPCLAAKADELLSAAIQAGSRDNISILLVRMTELPPL